MLIAGDTTKFDWVFTRQGVESFTKISWDEGEHNVLARTMNFCGLFTTDAIHKEVTNGRYDRRKTSVSR